MYGTVSLERAQTRPPRTLGPSGPGQRPRETTGNRNSLTLARSGSYYLDSVETSTNPRVRVGDDDDARSTEEAFRPRRTGARDRSSPSRDRLGCPYRNPRKSGENHRKRMWLVALGAPWRPSVNLPRTVYVPHNNSVITQ